MLVKANMLFSKEHLVTTGISAFLRELSTGRLSSPLIPLAGITDDKLPNVVDRQPWDGQDGKFDFVEDIDLSDVNLDDGDDNNIDVTPKKKVDL